LTGPAAPCQGKKTLSVVEKPDRGFIAISLNDIDVRTRKVKFYILNIIAYIEMV